MSDLLAAARAWLDADPEAGTRDALATILATPSRHGELDELFGSRLEFGTAGLRGVLGPGPNRMNRAVVRRTTLGLGHYLLAQVPEVRQNGVVLGRDGRRMSEEFLADAAAVLAALDIPVHVYDGVIPTPLVAFAVSHLKAAAGVMITASHNPPAYNGYKVYWGNGAQIIPPHDTGIARAIDGAGSAKSITLRPQSEAGSLWQTISESVETNYLDATMAVQLHREVPRNVGLAYTPLHGVGRRLAIAAFTRAGFNRVEVVAEQAEPDGAFPTVAFPNPEEPGAMDLLLELAKQARADLAIANDPDADRLALAVRDRDGRFVQLTGDEVGVLLGHYLLTQGPRNHDTLVVTTIVSSSQLGVIARALGVRYAETLTGFKWIANQGLALEASSSAKFVFGYEEALGYCVGRAVHDKDGISGAVLAADLAAFCHAHGRTILDELGDIQRRYGVFLSAQKSVGHPGAEGAARIQAMMAQLRASPPESIGAHRVRAIRDVREGVRHEGGQTSRLDLPSSDVLIFDLEGDARVIVRPSGTEPKIKFYFEVRQTVLDGEALPPVRARGKAALADLQAAFLRLVES